MTTVETIGRIRRAYFVQRQSVREMDTPSTPDLEALRI